MSFPMAAAAKQQAFLRFFFGFFSGAQRADFLDFLFGKKMVELQGFGTLVVTAYRALRPESRFQLRGHFSSPTTVSQERFGGSIGLAASVVNRIRRARYRFGYGSVSPAFPSFR
jgi:hypothetical protein